MRAYRRAAEIGLRFVEVARGGGHSDREIRLAIFVGFTSTAAMGHLSLETLQGCIEETWRIPHLAGGKAKRDLPGLGGADEQHRVSQVWFKLASEAREMGVEGLELVLAVMAGAVFLSRLARHSRKEVADVLAGIWDWTDDLLERVAESNRK